jgi:ribonuclease PH
MNDLRPIHIVSNYLKYPEGSCLFQMGNTKVLCTASFSNPVPDFAKEKNMGWITAEYSMLPRATVERSSRGKIASGGRTKEIQRLIGRSLRAVVDLEKMPDILVNVDCDVLQADGGTRTASINGAFIALVQALRKWQKNGRLTEWPVRDSVAAVSVGIVDGRQVLDLDYSLDVKADVDLNVVMTGSGRYVEIQGTAEHAPFSRADLDKLLRLAQGGIRQVLARQKKQLGDICS